MPDSKKLARVVIGANFGDEGKGLLTDYYAAAETGQCTVVRYNGGAQAGHTVVTPEGRRHIFSHFGSGSLVGAATFLSRYFIVNPKFFANERQALGLGLRIDPLALVSVPYDRLINEIVEEARGVNRHGSVGVGINETVRRSEHDIFRLTVQDLSFGAAWEKLKRIAFEWVPRRLNELGFPNILKSSDLEMLQCEKVRERFAYDCKFLLINTLRHSLGLLGPSHDHHFIFEGAQGLMLDPDYGAFPHVTPSHTGLKNVVPLAAEVNVDELDVTYVTRCYVTRHGAGPLPFECEKPYPGIVDETNLPHKFQGELRFSPLNIDSLKDVIGKDLKHAEGKIPVRLALAVTCLDQVGDAPLRYIHNGQEARADVKTVLKLLKAEIQPTKMLTASGPTRNDVRVWG